MNIFDQIREALEPGYVARRAAGERERALMASREEFYKSVAEDFSPAEDLSCCNDTPGHCHRTDPPADDDRKKYADKTAEQTAFTMLVMSGNFGPGGPSLCNWGARVTRGASAMIAVLGLAYAIWPEV